MPAVRKNTCKNGAPCGACAVFFIREGPHGDPAGKARVFVYHALRAGIQPRPRPFSLPYAQKGAGPRRGRVLFFPPRAGGNPPRPPRFSPAFPTHGGGPGGGPPPFCTSFIFRSRPASAEGMVGAVLAQGHGLPCRGRRLRRAARRSGLRNAGAARRHAGFGREGEVGEEIPHGHAQRDKQHHQHDDGRQHAAVLFARAARRGAALFAGRLVASAPAKYRGRMLSVQSRGSFDCENTRNQLRSRPMPGGVYQACPWLVPQPSSARRTDMGRAGLVLSILRSDVQLQLHLFSATCKKRGPCGVGVFYFFPIFGR